MVAKKKSTAEASANPKVQNNHSTRKAKYSSLLLYIPNDTHVYECMSYLIRRGKITNAEAVLLDNNYRLSSTIDALRKVYGVPIRTEMKKNKNTGRMYGVYHLEV